MKNLIGFFPLPILLTLLFLFSFTTNESIAQQNITKKGNIYYDISENGDVSFKYRLRLTAEKNFTTAISKYTLNFPYKDLDFFTIKSDGENLRARRETENGTMKLILDLDEKILNHSSPIEIELEGQVKTPLIREIGGTRILTLPGSMSNINIEDVKITYPKSFGNITNLHNEWIIQQNDKTITLKSQGAGKVINLLWGSKIVYDFEINKNFFNTPEEPKRTFDLNIPKSHGNQKVLFFNIEPLPNFAYQDAEGNLFFSYELDANREIDVNISGQIEIDFAKEARDSDLEVFQKPILTETKGYWLLTNEYELNRLKVFLSREGIEENNIDEMDFDTRQKFYKQAYKYVVDRLEIGDFKQTSMESYIRQGANHAVENRQISSPEDYVDLLSAIYRKYNVPTRMIEGYVTMLNEGFYHSWVEYWNEDEGWQKVDPALEHYSGGNYFDSELFNHITILSRSYNYIRPRIVFFDKDEFIVDFSENIREESLSVDNTLHINPLKKAQEYVKGILKIENTGNTILSMKNFANQEKFSFSNHNALQIVVPGQILEIPFLYKSKTLNNKNELFLEYESINNSSVLKTINLNLQEQEFWWWTPFVIILKYTVISIIVYIIYLILQKGYRWIEKYYQ